MLEKEVVSDDDLLTVALNSSDDEQPEDFPKFNIERDMEKPDLEVGHLFTNVQDFRLAVRHHSIVNEFEINWKRNDNDRIVITCKRNCGWKVYASEYRDTKQFQIKTLDGTPHQCPHSYKNKSANAK